MEHKLIKLVRTPDGRVRAYINDHELQMVDFREDYGRAGHTYSITVIEEQVEWSKD
jgi:hypothetical protein